MPFSNPQEMGRPVAIKDEGVTLTTSASSIDFVGGGVSGTAVGAAVTETISGSAANYAVDETPSGTINGTNVTFVLAHTPIAGTLALYYGTRLKLSVDYTLSTATITMTIAPVAGASLLADYQY